MAIKASDIRDGLYAWASANSGVDTVIWLHPDAPRPPRPYATLLIGVIQPIGQDYLGDVNEDGARIIRGTRELTVSVAVYEKPSAHPNEAAMKAEAMRNSLRKQSVRHDFADKGIVYVDDFGVQDLTQLIDTTFEGRAEVDLLFRTTSEIEDDVGFIQTVEVEGEISKTEDGPTMKREFTVALEGN